MWLKHQGFGPSSGHENSNVVSLKSAKSVKHYFRPSIYSTERRKSQITNVTRKLKDTYLNLPLLCKLNILLATSYMYSGVTVTKIIFLITDNYFLLLSCAELLEVYFTDLQKNYPQQH